MKNQKFFEWEDHVGIREKTEVICPMKKTDPVMESGGEKGLIKDESTIYSEISKEGPSREMKGVLIAE